MLSHFLRKLGAVAAWRPRAARRARGLGWRLAPRAGRVRRPGRPGPPGWGGILARSRRKLGAVAAGRPGAAVRAGGLVWRLAPGAAGVLGPGGPDLAGWEAGGQAEPVKQNLQRTITRVRLPGGTVYVKRCR